MFIISSTCQLVSIVLPILTMAAAGLPICCHGTESKTCMVTQHFMLYFHCLDVIDVNNVKSIDHNLMQEK
jgi:hypothetical protein